MINSGEGPQTRRARYAGRLLEALSSWRPSRLRRRVAADGGGSLRGGPGQRGIQNLAGRAGRRLTIGAAVACAAFAVPAAALAASASAHTPARLAAVPACRAAGASGTITVAWIGLPGDGHAGGMTYELEFSNISRQTCTLYGHPGVSAIDSNGHQVGPPATWFGVPHTVTLTPGATAHANLEVVDAGAMCSPVTAAYLRVYPPGQKTAWPEPLSVQVCPNRAAMSVAPVSPGTGVPFYSH
jgi:hypothetical protein